MATELQWSPNEPAGGAPILLVHGHTSSKETWLAVGQDIADRCHATVYAMDLRGHGQAPLPPDDDYSMSTIINDVRTFLDQHALDRVHLLGHSMGGRIATCFAAAHPSRLVSLIIEDMDTLARRAGARKGQAEVEELRAFQQRRHGRAEARAAALSLGYDASRVEAWIETSRILKLEQEKSDDESAYHIGIHPYSTYHCLHQLLADNCMEGALRTLGAKHGPSSSSPLPVLLLVASERSAVNRTCLESMKGLHPAMLVDIVPNSHHSIHRANVEYFLSSVASFIDNTK